MKRIMVLIVVIINITALMAQAHETFTIKEERGTYQLNFATTYCTYLAQDIELAITLPKGYTFASAMPGSPDFISANPIQNIMYVSKLVDHDIETNLTLNIVTPEGTENTLIFKLIGRKNTPKVLAIHFERPGTSETNRAIESMKSRYEEQLSQKLTDQEIVLNSRVHDSTMSVARMWFFDCERGDVDKEYKGARVFVDGMINSRDYTYIYLRSNIKKGECDIIKLIKVKGPKKLELEAELLSVKEDNGEYFYVYKIPQIAIPKKEIKLYFVVTIWSEKFEIKVKVS